MVTTSGKQDGWIADARRSCCCRKAATIWHGFQVLVETIHGGFPLRMLLN